MFSAIRTTSQLTSACLARNLRITNAAARSFHCLPPRLQVAQPGAAAGSKESATNSSYDLFDSIRLIPPQRLMVICPTHKQRLNVL